jgi:hypothetical protein
LPGSGSSFRGRRGDGDPLTKAGAAPGPDGCQQQGGDKRFGRIEAHAEFLLALVEDEGRPTLADIQARHPESNCGYRTPV